MFELDRTRSKQSVQQLSSQEFRVVDTNGHVCIVNDTNNTYWMSVPLANHVDLYPMRAI